MKNLIRVTLLSFLLPLSVEASIVLKQIEVESPTSFNISFSSEVHKNQTQVEFLGDIIQVTMTDVAVYPPKIIPVTGGPITKIFAYQYSPKSVRCRFSVKGKADDLNNRFKLNMSGKRLSIKVDVPKSSQEKSEKVGDELEEDLLLEKVLKAQAPPAHSEKPVLLTRKEEFPARLGGKVSKPLGPAMIKIFVFMTVILVLAALVKRMKNTKNIKANWFVSRLGKKSSALIEVISTQHLGPKKAITLVQIKGRTLVLGVTDESIQLITEISALSEADGVSTDQLTEFSDLLTTEKATPQSSSSHFTQQITQQFSQQARFIKGDKSQQGARSQIKSRLEGLKPL
jgi:flagellar biogenesis protein FliO